MTTVAHCFGHSNPTLHQPHPKLAYNSNIGIELEVEGLDHIEIPLWNCTEDGSLRDGCELVCAAPYSGEVLFEAIENLSNAIGRSSAKGTWRCSTHVHLDVRDCTDLQVKKAILAWGFYEKMMFKCSGFHRFRSNFCPAFSVVQAQIMNASASFNSTGSRFFSNIVGCWDKYTSLNLLPLRDFGSIEFRISEPKWKKTNLINLVNRFLVVKKLVVEHDGNLESFVEHLREQGFTPMIPYLPLDYVPDVTDLEEGYDTARDILSLRSSDVNVVNRVRSTEIPEASLNTPIPTDSLGHWDSYVHYLMSRSEYRMFNEQTGINLHDRRVVTREEVETLIDWCSNCPSDNSSIRLTIPNGLRQNLRTYFGEE